MTRENEIDNKTIKINDELLPLPPPSVKSPKYIPIEAIVALKEKKLSHGQIAKILGCSNSNISLRISNAGYSPDLIQAYARDRAKIYKYYQSKIINKITDADIEKAGLLEKVKSVSFLHNQERLEEGKSTQNIAYADIVKAKHSLYQRKLDLERKFPELMGYSDDDE